MDAKAFLAHIFDGCNGVPVTVSADEGYKARRWTPGQDPPAGEGYYCISTVRDIPRQRILSRQTTDLVDTYAVVLDDIGTKVSRETLRLQPSYKLETSDGNEHWGYIFDQPVDPARAAALIDALAAAGLTDPGAKRADRIMRYPGSLNTKYDPPFAARLIEWHPDRLFSYTDVAVGLGVVPSDVDLKGNTTALAEGQSDPTFSWMGAHDMVLAGPNPRGWYAVRCPQEHLHTGEVDHGTDYLPGNPGAFKCLHGHCAGFGTTELKAWILAQDPSAELGPIDRGHLANVAARLAASLGIEPVRAQLDQADNSGSVPADGQNSDLAALGRALQAQAAAGSIFTTERRGGAPVPPNELEEHVLNDLIHVGSEDAYWSIEAQGLLSHKGVDDRWTSRMAQWGLLDAITPTGRPTTIAPHIWLRRHPEVLRVAKIVHRVGEPLIVQDCLNIAPALPAWREVTGDVGLWLDLVSFICKNDKALENWLIDWCAMVVGDPWEKPGWHILIRGVQGTGKNLMMLPIVEALGEAHAEKVNVVALGGQFNTFLAKRFLYVEELKMNTRGVATGHDVYANLKAWTALGAKTMTVNEKFRTPYDVADRSCWHLSSNETVPLPIEEGDRRLLVIETPNRKGPMEWYGRIRKWYEHDDGFDKVVTYLRQRWAAMPEVRRDLMRGEPPMTDAKIDMVESAAEGIAGAVMLAIRGRNGVEWPDLMRLEDVVSKLRLGVNGLLPDNLIKQVSQQRVIPALKEAGAVRLFEGNNLKLGTRYMRLWCLRPSKAAMYEQLGMGQKLFDRYDEMHKADNVLFKLR